MATHPERNERRYNFYTEYRKPLATKLYEYVKCIWLESRNNPTRLPAVATRVLLARIRFGIGPIKFALLGLARAPYSTYGQYLTDAQFYWRAQRDAVTVRHDLLLTDKLRFENHCEQHDLPTITNICIITNNEGTVCETRSRVLTNNERREWPEILDAAPDRLFVKPSNGTHGEGAFALHRLTENKFYISGTKNVLSPDALFKYLQKQFSNNTTALLIQPQISNHPDLAHISGSSGLSTVRVVTAMIGKNQAKVILAIARFPVKDHITDNFSGGLSGNLVAEVDLNNGQLSAARHSTSSDWPLMRSIAKHPDTRNQIHGAQLPHWQNVMALAVRAQHSLPDMKSVGWDIGISNGGAFIIEANSFYDIELLQVAYQRGLGPKLLELYDK